MVTESRLTAAIIGAGKIAGMYADPMAERATTHAQAINKSNNIDLVGIVDSNMMKAQIFADRWNLPNTFPTVDKLLDTIKCDLIAICSPDQTHAEILNSIAQHKASPRFVTAEKPLCTAPDQLAAIEKNIGGNKNIQIALNHVRRFDARHQMITKMIAENTWGQPISARWVYYGGWFHTGVHVIDTLQMLLGDTLQIKEVKSGFTDRAEDPSLDLSMSLSKLPNIPILIESFPESAFQLFEGEIRFQEGRVRFLDFGEEVYIEKVRVNEISERELGKAELLAVEDAETPMEKLYNQAIRWLKNGDVGILNTVDLTSASQIMRLLFKAKACADDYCK